MVNKAILVGNLGSDPEMRYTQSGTAVATLSLATSRRWKDKSGQQQDETEWHRIVVWDKSAEFCGNYLKKGMKVYVEGRLQTRKWRDNSGVDRYTTEIVANNVLNLSPRDENADANTMGHVEDENANTGEFSVGDDVPF